MTQIVSAGKHRPRFVFIGLSVMLVLLASSSSVNASSQAIPGVPPASDCLVEPLTTAEIVELAQNLNSATTSERQSGEAAAQDDVNALIWELVACTNANEPLQWLALFTDRYVAQRFGPDNPDDLASLLAALSRDPAPAAAEEALELTEVGEAELLPGDFVSVTVVTTNRSAIFEDELILVVEGDRLLVDDVVNLQETSIDEESS